MIITAYHGTVKRFTQFATSPSGLHFGSLGQASHRCCVLMARLSPRQFEKLPLMTGGQPGYILRAQLDIRRPGRVDDLRTNDAWARAIKKARAQGFDALCYRNEFEMPSESADSWVIFDPTQVIRIDFPFNPPEPVETMHGTPSRNTPFRKTRPRIDKEDLSHA